MSQTIIPIFRIFDYPKAVEFYVNWLGFTIAWEHRFGENSPVYLEITKGDLKLHLSEHHSDATPGSKVLIDYPELESFHKELIAKNYHYMKPGFNEAFWGAWVVNVIDPFGNRLEFFQRIEKPVTP
ncbi:glyoxalase superfamily protein [Larkinella rosea]|uniref:Bleomycin resistance protein n=1 Tax=Larkinella rosea TaxID=2025312 RepID=A0A3P1BP62_9BACT|nr:glyoxalase superfamily protein [Larkinella rosea]RRB02851.1 VOC family protein [Larkinella rosea]